MGRWLRLFLDTNVFLFAVGGDHRYRQPCRDILGALAQDRFEALINVEVLQEYVHVRARKGIDRADAISESSQIISACRVEDVTMTQLQMALSLFVPNQSLSLRDAIHVSTAMSAVADGVLSADRGLDSVPGVNRIDPIDFAAELGRGSD